HGKTAFALRGKHGDVRCEACHKTELPADKRFRGLSFGLCRDCHKDAHDGEFLARNQGECGACHTERGFKPTSFSVAIHGTTAFALEGKHQAVPCGKCHFGKSAAPEPVEEPTPKKGKLPLARGKAKALPAAAPIVRRLAWKITESACANCHQNPHGDQFADVMKQKGCAGCHVAGGWKMPKIDHKIWPLTGAHAQAACDRCHSPTAEDRKAGKGGSYKNVPRECNGCHADPHAAQFSATAPARACNDCHNTASFKLPGFDHAKQAHYSLEG